MNNILLEEDVATVLKVNEAQTNAQTDDIDLSLYKLQQVGSEKKLNSTD